MPKQMAESFQPERLWHSTSQHAQQDGQNTPQREEYSSADWIVVQETTRIVPQEQGDV